MLKARKPRGGPEFATGLIAAKPLKPCDGAVFGALNSLLKTERKKRNSKRGGAVSGGFQGLSLGCGGGWRRKRGFVFACGVWDVCGFWRSFANLYQA